MFTAAHAWTAGTGSPVWRGITEAERTEDFERIKGNAGSRIADLSRSLVDADLDDGGDGVALEWHGITSTNGSFGKCAAGANRIDVRFHGPATRRPRPHSTPGRMSPRLERSGSNVAPIGDTLRREANIDLVADRNPTRPPTCGPTQEGGQHSHHLESSTRSGQHRLRVPRSSRQQRDRPSDWTHEPSPHARAFLDEFAVNLDAPVVRKESSGTMPSCRA